MEFFVALVNGGRLQSNNFKDLHLRCSDGFGYIPVKQSLGLIKNIKIDLFFHII